MGNTISSKGKLDKRPSTGHNRPSGHNGAQSTVYRSNFPSADLVSDKVDRDSWAQLEQTGAAFQSGILRNTLPSLCTKWPSLQGKGQDQWLLSVTCPQGQQQSKETVTDSPPSSGRSSRHRHLPQEPSQRDTLHWQHRAPAAQSKPTLALGPPAPAHRASSGRSADQAVHPGPYREVPGDVHVHTTNATNVLTPASPTLNHSGLFSKGSCTATGCSVCYILCKYKLPFKLK